MGREHNSGHDLTVFLENSENTRKAIVAGLQ